MNYAIYRTTDTKHPHIIHRFTQGEWNHQAKLHARRKLREMFCRVAQRVQSARNLAADTKDEFSYDYQTSENTTERIRFYIAELK